METLQTLGVALGFASLAGVNLYLTVFVTGLAIQQHWISLSQTYPELAVLGHPAILGVAGVLYLLQFFADKVPWVDSLWDGVHTIIRPIGGAFLVLRVLGTVDPVVDVIGALMAGGVSLMTHSVKAGTRLVVNHSPEPFSNIAVSVTEDVAVLGGLALIKYSVVHSDPWLLLAVFGSILVCIAYFGPKLFRAVRANFWLMWKKVTSPSVDELSGELLKTLPVDEERLHRRTNPQGAPIVWAAACLSQGAKNIPGNLFGYLVATSGDELRVAFVASRRFQSVAEVIDLRGYRVAHEAKFFSENIVLDSLEKKTKYVFLFARSERALVQSLKRFLEERLCQVAPVEVVSEGATASPVLGVG